MLPRIIAPTLGLLALLGLPLRAKGPVPSWRGGMVAPTIMTASWYGPYFHGRRTANGEIFNRYDPTTAAHKTLPFGTRLLVCHELLCATVRINDRGPYISGRHLDLSEAAAEQIGMKDKGVAKLRVWRVE